MADGAAPHFLSLPIEIREQIYTELLLVEINRVYMRNDQSDAEPPPAGLVEAEWPRKRSRLDIDLRIYRVNKQISQEAKDQFSRINTFVCVQSPFPDTEHNMEARAGVLVVAAGEPARTFKNCHLHCIIDAPEMVVRDCCRFIIPLQDLEAFCQLWFYYDIHHDAMLNHHLSLNLFLTREWPRQLQQRLLTPFGRLKALGGFTVSGPHAQEVETSVREAMTMPYDTPSQCLNTSARLKDAGNAALIAGDPHKALELYRDAFAAMHIVIDGRTRQVWADTFFEISVANGQFKGQWGGVVRVTLRVQLVAGTVKAYMKLCDFREAYYWGRRTVNLLRNAVRLEENGPRQDFPAAPSLGEIYFWTARAARELGKGDTARDLLRIAAMWLPDDPNVQKDKATWGV